MTKSTLTRTQLAALTQNQDWAQIDPDAGIYWNARTGEMIREKAARKQRFHVDGGTLLTPSIARAVGRIILGIDAHAEIDKAMSADISAEMATI